MIDTLFRQMWYDGTTPGLTGLRLLLTPFSLIYGLSIALRNKRFDRGLARSVRLPGKVISIGNLSVGGTGKTPMVIGLARMLRDRGYRPAVLSRGYGGTSKHPVNIVSMGTQLLMNHREAGDEPVLIAKSVTDVPVLTGPRRDLTGERALQDLKADVLILDDGFQHRQIYRDIDIVLLDGTNPYGNGHLLPGGPLREPLCALKRADILIATGAVEKVAACRPIRLPDGIHAPLFRCCYQPGNLLEGAAEKALPPDFIKGKRVLAFAGIGNPSAFEKTLTALGATVAMLIPFPDHHRYLEADFDRITAKARQCGANMIITTEKDKIKLDGHEAFLRNVYTLRVDMAFLSGRDDFEKLILAELGKSHAG